MITFRRWNTLKIVWILDSFRGSKINQNCPISLPFKSPATDFLFRIKKYSNFLALLMLWNAGHLLIKEFAGAKSIATLKAPIPLCRTPRERYIVIVRLCRPVGAPPVIKQFHNENVIFAVTEQLPNYSFKKCIFFFKN